MPTDILYIAGAGRSGTTLLGGILGQVPGCFMAGEVFNIFLRRNWHTNKCSCGQSTLACDLWGQILNPVLGNPPDTNAERLHNLWRSVGRNRQIVPLLTQREALRREHAADLALLRDLYLQIQTVTGAEVIIDTMKLPTLAYLLSLVPEFRVHMVHVVRNPNAVAYSWNQKRYIPELGRDMDRYHPAKAAADWMVWNTISPLLAKRGQMSYLRLRYEDFVDEPVPTLNRILAPVNKEVSSTMFDGQNVAVNKDHVLGGNPLRFDSNPLTTLQRDDRWQAGLSLPHKALVTGLTLPLWAYYGYWRD